MAGVGSALPAASVAKTERVCLPFLSFFNFSGEEQLAAAEALRLLKEQKEE